MAFPIVDLLPFSLQDGSLFTSRQVASTELVQALKRFGFCTVTGHGVPPSLLDEAFVWNKRLFDLRHEEKMQAPHPVGSHPHRGYSPPGLEKVYGKDEGDKGNRELRKVMDFKESFEVGSEQNHLEGNIWLPENILPGFRDFMTRFYWELDKAAKIFIRALAAGLALPNDELDMLLDVHSGHWNQLRLLHYPAVDTKELEAEILTRMPPHTDWSSFTFLFQDTVGGLELVDPQSKTFLPATPVPHALVVNVGDMLQRITNDLLPSATHRVKLPPLQQSTVANKINGFEANPQQLTQARYSIPYFVSAFPDAILGPLPSLVQNTGPKYDPISPKQYGEMRSAHWYTAQTDAPAI